MLQHLLLPLLLPLPLLPLLLLLPDTATAICPFTLNRTRAKVLRRTASSRGLCTEGPMPGGESPVDGVLPG